MMPDFDFRLRAAIETAKLLWGQVENITPHVDVLDADQRKQYDELKRIVRTTADNLADPNNGP